MKPKEHQLEELNCGSKQLLKIVLIFGCGFDVNFGTPRAPSDAKTMENEWRVVQNRRSTFSFLRASDIDFGSQNGIQNHGKHARQSMQNSITIVIDYY